MPWDGTAESQNTWATYSPGWVNTVTNPTIGNGSLLGYYDRDGRSTDFLIVLTIGSTTTFGSGAIYRLSLPFPAFNARWRFTGTLQDASPAGDYTVFGRWDNSVTAIDLVTMPTTAGNPDRAVNATVPITLATGDVLTIGGRYMAAS